MKRVLLVITLLGIVALVGCVKATPTISEGFGILGAEIGYVNETENEVIYAGVSGAAQIMIVNGYDMERDIKLSLVSPNTVKEGFESFPEQYFSWITMSPMEFHLAKGESKAVRVTLSMPMETDYINKKAEVRIRVEDVGQTGIVQIAVEARWYIVTAE
jgi:hypothetical protein